MAKEFHVLMIEDDPAHAEIIRRSLKCCTCANRITPYIRWSGGSRLYFSARYVS